MAGLYPYAGGSGAIAPLVASIIRRENKNWRYAEPMFGSGAVFKELHPGTAYLGDINELITNLLFAMKNTPTLLASSLHDIQPHKFRDYQADIRNQVKTLVRASWWYFLLVTCYNGVVKFNTNGVPTLYPGTRIETWAEDLPKWKTRIQQASTLLQNTEIHCRDFAATPAGHICFFDPPWFGSDEDYGVDFDHERLAAFLKKYDGLWLMTINDCEDAQSTYLPISEWQKSTAPYYAVAPVAHGRGKREELLLTNFKPRMFGG